MLLWFNAVKARILMVWKRWSIKIVAAQAILIAVWTTFSLAGFTPTLPDWVKGGVVLLFSLAALTAAPIKQTGVT